MKLKYAIARAQALMTRMASQQELERRVTLEYGPGRINREAVSYETEDASLVLELSWYDQHSYSWELWYQEDGKAKIELYDFFTLEDWELTYCELQDTYNQLSGR